MDIFFLCWKGNHRAMVRFPGASSNGEPLPTLRPEGKGAPTIAQSHSMRCFFD